MFGSAQANALGPEADSGFAVLGVICVAANLKSASVVCPGHKATKVFSDSSLHSGDNSRKHLPRPPVKGQGISRCKWLASKLIPLGVLHFAAKERGRHLVRLVADHEVPAAIGSLQLGLHVLIAGQLVEPGDGEVSLREPVAGAGRLQLVVRRDLKRQLEFAREFVLPLFDEVAGTDNQAPLEVSASDQLFDQQSRHDRLARAGIVGKQEAQRLPGQHRLVDRGDLVRQWVDVRRVNRQQRVKQMSEPNPLRLRNKPEQRAVAVEAPRAAFLNHFKACLVIAVEEHAVGATGRVLEGEFDGVRAEPLHVDDGHEPIGNHAANRRRLLEVLESRHAGALPGFECRPEQYRQLALGRSMGARRLRCSDCPEGFGPWWRRCGGERAQAVDAAALSRRSLELAPARLGESNGLRPGSGQLRLRDQQMGQAE